MGKSSGTRAPAGGRLAAPRPEVLASMTDQHVMTALDHASDAMSRAEIAEATGLSKPAVSSAAARLLERGVLRDAGIREGRRGGVATLYELNPDHAQCLAIVIQNDLITVQSRDLRGTVRARVETAVAATSDSTEVAAATNRLIHEASEAFDAPVRAAAVSIADPVDVASGEPVRRERSVFPGAAIRPRVDLDLPASAEIAIDNDVNWATVGEYREGLLRGCENFIYVYVGQGLGAGLLLNGQLFRGHRGLAGEIGYLRDAISGVDITESLAAHGLGSPDRYGIDLTLATEALLADPPGPAAVAGAEVLAMAIANIAIVLNPTAIAFGGPLSVHPVLVDAMQNRVSALSIDTPQFVVSTSTPLLGADLEAHRLIRAEAGMAT